MGKGELTRQAALAEGARLASVVGLSGLTIGSLATSLGMSKSGLFAHFAAKEALQLEVLRYGTEMFTDQVIRPALATPRGEPRVRALFEHKLAWDRNSLPGGCLFVAWGAELDDQPGPVREHMVGCFRDWLEVIAQVFRTGIGEGHFRPDADPEQFAQDFEGVLLAYHYTNRLQRSAASEARARRAFENLLAAVRVT